MIPYKPSRKKLSAERRAEVAAARRVRAAKFAALVEEARRWPDSIKDRLEVIERAARMDWRASASGAIP